MTQFTSQPVNQLTKRHGFTLVELLVVVTIIAVLIAILLPSFSQARVAAKNVLCMSHQRQTWLATVNYAADHDRNLPDLDALPATSHGLHMLWCWSIPVADQLRQQYLGDQWQLTTCPFDDYPSEDIWLGRSNGFRITSYAAACNPRLTATGSGGMFNTFGQNYAALRMSNKPNMVLLMDTANYVPLRNVDNIWAWRFNTAPHSWLSTYGFHVGDLSAKDGSNLGGINVTSLDGSTVWRPFSQMKRRVVQVLGEVPNREYWW